MTTKDPTPEAIEFSNSIDSRPYGYRRVALALDAWGVALIKNHVDARKHNVPVAGNVNDQMRISTLTEELWSAREYSGAEIARLHPELEAEKAAHAVTRSSLEFLEGYRSVVEPELEALKAERVKSDEQIEALVRQRNLIQMRQDALRGELDATRKELATEREQRQLRQQEVLVLERDIRQMANEHEDTRKALSVARTQSDHWSKQENERAKERDTSKRELDATRKELVQAREALVQIQDAYSASRMGAYWPDKYRASQVEIEATKAELVGARAGLEALAHQRDVIQSNRDESSRVRERLESELARAIARIHELEVVADERDKLKAELECSRRQNANLFESYRSLQQSRMALVEDASKPLEGELAEDVAIIQRALSDATLHAADAFVRIKAALRAKAEPHSETLQALANMGHDTECGACMGVAFTGEPHTCKARGEPQAAELPGFITYVQSGTAMVCDKCGREVATAPELPRKVEPGSTLQVGARYRITALSGHSPGDMRHHEVGDVLLCDEGKPGLQARWLEGGQTLGLLCSAWAAWGPRHEGCTYVTGLELVAEPVEGE